jgi:hypothetical protein
VLCSRADPCASTLSGQCCSADARAAFAAEMGPVLLRLTSAATQIQLRRLHEQTECAFATLAPQERAFVHVVVAGVHQARTRSLAMQYFQKRFGEPPGAERRVTYAEAVSTERAALELVGTQRLDRVIANAFFGDARRLQRDILGDAAAEQLHGLALGPELAEQSDSARSAPGRAAMPGTIDQAIEKKRDEDPKIVADKQQDLESDAKRPADRQRKLPHESPRETPKSR